MSGSSIWDESSRDDATCSTLLKNLCEARTLEQITNALKSIPPVPEAEYVRLPTIRPKRRLIMRDGMEGGGITQSEYLIAKHASEHRIPKRVTTGILETLRRPDFDNDNIRHNTIENWEQIEHLISKAHDGSTIQEFNLWTEKHYFHKCCRLSAEGSFRRYLGDGAVFSSADWCVGAVHMPSVRLRCKRMVAVLDGEPDFQGGSHLWAGSHLWRPI